MSKGKQLVVFAFCVICTMFVFCLYRNNTTTQLISALLGIQALELKHNDMGTRNEDINTPSAVNPLDITVDNGGHSESQTVNQQLDHIVTGENGGNGESQTVNQQLDNIVVAGENWGNSESQTKNKLDDVIVSIGNVGDSELQTENILDDVVMSLKNEDNIESQTMNRPDNFTKQSTENPDVDQSSLLSYKPPPNLNLHEGRQFNVTAEMRKSHGIPLNKFSIVDQSNVDDFVFATGVSSNHFDENLDAVACVQHHYPGYTLFYYDLGLAEYQISKVKTMKNVVYRVFNTSEYPVHVGTRRTYSFKPLIIHEILHEYPGVFWIDSSARLHKNLTTVYTQIIHNNGFLMFWPAQHSNAIATHPMMYEYIPVNVEQEKETPQHAASALLLYRTSSLYWTLTYWWVMCALDPNCIAPEHSQNMTEYCQVKDQVQSFCPDFHRFDQSAINALAINLNQNSSTYYTQDEGILSLMRKKTNLYPLQLKP